MPRRPFDFQDKSLPPPERFTTADLLHIGLGALMIPLGIIILARTLTMAVTVAGVLVGGAFVGFGVYRLWLAWNRYRLYQQNKGRNAR